ncbi:hypothetical protein HXX76_005783 [Chlamydomonas incerta]|uniref:phytol kinase n=1 Tax=Chlamydomonas incerta TaxID=51695 RepID=A0A835W2I8_CHLIN|nr:hypothetical protein HXX76_005783 [Chlamydomonas incerta]|eukprot:KAG2438177.1 hypothetical protein HXX76_005783 [Chlamydomonas incerta]
MPPRGRPAAAARREQPHEAARVQTLILQLGKRAAAEGTLMNVPQSEIDELDLLVVNVAFRRGMGISTQLDQHGTPEFWAATYAVNSYALRDYCALYEQMQSLLEQRPAPQGSAAWEEDWVESPRWQQLKRTMKRISSCVNQLQFVSASCDGMARTSAGHERRVLAMLRSDTLKSYAAMFDMMARGRLNLGFACSVTIMISSLLTLVLDCMGVYAQPCNSKDDYDLELYGAFVKAAADSHMLDHACRAALRLSDFVVLGQVTWAVTGAAAQDPAAVAALRDYGLRPEDLARRKELGYICKSLGTVRNAINKVLSYLTAPLAGEQALGALHPRPLAAPRSGTDPALLALLPAVRGVLSSTGVQMWVAKQLLDAANAVAEEDGVGGSAEGVSRLRARDHYLGLPLAARLRPHHFTATGEHPLQRPSDEAAGALLRNAMHVAAATWQVCRLVIATLARVLMSDWRWARMGPGHFQAEIAQALLLLSRLVKELGASQAQRLLPEVWAVLGAWLAFPLPLDSLTAARQVLPQLGALLLHVCPGEREVAEEAAAQDDGGLQPSGYPFALRAAHGFMYQIHNTAVNWLSETAAVQRLHGGYCRFIADMVDALLRQSCVLPVLIAHTATPSALDLVVNLRAVLNFLQHQGLVSEAAALHAVLTQLLEQLVAVWMRPLPEGVRGAEYSHGAAGAPAAGRPVPGAAVPAGLAAAIDSTAAALLTKASRAQVPKSRLHRMWLAAHARPDEDAMLPAPVSAVFMVAQLLPVLSGLRHQDLTRPDVPKDSILALTRAYTAVALHAMHANAMAPACSSPLTASEARAESWRALLFAQEGVVVFWAMAALDAAVKRQWCEGLDAALDLLELLVLFERLLSAPSGTQSPVQLDPDELATRPPSGTALPLVLTHGWLKQQGRGELAVALREAQRNKAAAMRPASGGFCRLMERLCGGCRAVRYCCQECQRAHWKRGHKADCPRLGAAWKALGLA